VPQDAQLQEPSPEPQTQQDIQASKRNKLKRKLRDAEYKLELHKKQKNDESVSSLRDKLLLMNIDLDTKAFILDKYDTSVDLSNSDYTKAMNWLKTIVKIPYGNYKGFDITAQDDPDKIKSFFEKVKMKLDKNIHGLEDVKQEILEYVARKITNPKGKGHVLALYGGPGVGKTKIIQTLAEALDLPFHQINCGGLNDVAILTGHSETYVGSKPGKIVEVLTTSNYMNPIIYLDEIDKISSSKATEIFGVLTHLLDEEQNDKFQDNYLSNVNIDLSQVFFVLAFNDISKIDAIVSDRLKVIYINPPNIEDKITICQYKMIPDILNTINCKQDVFMTKEIIEYIISKKTQQEEGVRQLRKNIEKIFNRLNFDLLVQNFEDLKRENETIIIIQTYVDKILKEKETPRYLDMYL
jgi:ATP-dependent Lon protease